MKITKPLILGVVAGLALSTAAAVTPASADPVSGSYVAVGSDTLEASMDALANGTKATGSTVRIKANGLAIASYNAFGSAKIQTKTTGPYFTRPAGSGKGVEALIASIRGTGFLGTDVTGQVDIARSSSSAGSNANANGNLIYIPYGRDAISYAYLPVSGHESDLASLTTAQLKGLYDGSITTIGGTTVNVMIPQSSSGTRKTFLADIGVSTDSTCGVSACTSGSVPENDASQLTVPGSIIPFATSNWIAQANGYQVTTITGGQLLGTIDGNAAANGSAPNLVPNPAFYSTSYGRDTFLVVEYARINPADPKYDAVLAGLVDSTVTTSLTNFTANPTPSQPGAVKKKFGFLAPSTTTPTRAYAW